MQIRDRYAPSPTGLQHIGGIRTALFNYLFAKSQGGTFILRLEDTDRTRFDPSFVQNLYDTFEWLGIKWDEGPDVGGAAGPYIQSERFELYKKYADELIEKDKAYYCFCSAERLDKIREEREAARSSETGYDRHCRSISPTEAAERVKAGEAYTIRLKIPLGESTKFHDHLLGDIEWKNDDVNPDPVLLKSDGFPTYHLANIVDDHLMGITHVLRAQEWLSSTPLHVIMYAAFGWEHPEYCHLPMVMGQDGKKLSKRHGATSIDEFRRQGYIPEALLNYVALLGASYEEGKDIYTLDELAARFSLDKLNKAPAIFDYKKLEWYNGQYIRMKSDEELAELCLPYAVEAGLFGAGPGSVVPGPIASSQGKVPSPEQRSTFTAAMPLIKERLVFLHEATEKLGYLFSEPAIPAAEEFIPKKADLQQAVSLLRMGRDLVKPLAEAADDASAESLIKDWAEKNKVKLGDLMMPLRAAITGARVSPPLFGSLRILGAEKSLARVEKALAALNTAR
ncbi:glutamate--tRNA ligase [Spirochaetia bacterium]|nr:glutamate--tRNA ligase [Spirochaetia bacterium]